MSNYIPPNRGEAGRMPAANRHYEIEVVDARAPGGWRMVGKLGALDTKEGQKATTRTPEFFACQAFVGFLIGVCGFPPEIAMHLPLPDLSRMAKNTKRRELGAGEEVPAPGESDAEPDVSTIAFFELANLPGCKAVYYRVRKSGKIINPFGDSPCLNNP